TRRRGVAPRRGRRSGSPDAGRGTPRRGRGRGAPASPAAGAAPALVPVASRASCACLSWQGGAEPADYCETAGVTKAPRITLVHSALVRSSLSVTTASTPARVLAALLLVLLAACQKPAAAPSGPPWVRTDFWEKKPIVDFSPFESKWGRPSIQRIAFLGAEEVRDLSKVPAAQLIAFPKRTAGQIRALEQVAGSRLRWHVKLGAEPYFSFIPLGFEKPCPCVYRMGLRDAGGHLKEMYRVPAVAVGPIAQAAVEVDLREYAGSEVDVMLQVDPDPLPPPGQPTPQGSVLWGSPALYGRESAAAPRANPAKHPNILLVGIDTLRADAV